jgi:ABC-2 type transport system permease protein
LSLLDSDTRLLWDKEVQQLIRSPYAMLSSFVVPGALVVIGPIFAVVTEHFKRDYYAPSPSLHYAGVAVPKQAARLFGFSTIHASPADLQAGHTDAEGYFLYILLPVLFVLAALLTPVLTALHSLIGERERRSLELLMALPVVVNDIVAAKLAANVSIALATILPMFVVDAIVLVNVAHVGWDFVGWAAVLLVGSVTASVGASLLLALTARDLRTAMSSGGLMIAVPLSLTGLCVALLPGVERFAVLGFLLFALGVGAVYGGLRWLTYERYTT